MEGAAAAAPREGCTCSEHNMRECSTCCECATCGLRYAEGGGAADEDGDGGGAAGGAADEDGPDAA